MVKGQMKKIREARAAANKGYNPFVFFCLFLFW
jgi:hypothetical protein